MTIANPLRAIQTRVLLSELTKSDMLPEAATIATLLKLGANPWSMAHDQFDNSVLSLILLRCPEPGAIDAWFDAAGDLSAAPWASKGGVNPLVETMGSIKQTEIFHQKITMRLFNGGARLLDRDDIEQFVDAIFLNHRPVNKLTREIIDCLAADCPILLDAIEMADEEHKRGRYEQWKQVMRDQEQLAAQTPEVATLKRPPRL